MLSDTRVLIPVFLGILFVTFQNCSDPQLQFSGEAIKQSEMGNIGNVVCDPFGGGVNGKTGLAGKLRYFVLEGNAEHLNQLKANDYVNSGIDSGVTVVVGNLDIGNRPFTQGFPLGSSGTLLKDKNGNVLIEYFAIEFFGSIRLGDNDPEGLYRFGLNSDDGSVLEVKSSAGNYNTLINNDSVHGMRFVESSQVVEMKRNTVLPIRLIYFQGPRDSIGIQFQWKRENVGDSYKAIPTQNLMLPNGVQGCP